MGLPMLPKIFPYIKKVAKKPFLELPHRDWEAFGQVFCSSTHFEVNMITKVLKEVSTSLNSDINSEKP